LPFRARGEGPIDGDLPILDDPLMDKNETKDDKADCRIGVAMNRILVVVT
jgi:hypothetical protein